ncbi:MAG: DUF5693 family protein [Fimbriimonadales bacterium]|nr:DUF5693 family protein [Fimbriimonadales bacterium]MDW8052289.1 DUF5693 family protein [Armatimonadota bacterium]
MQRVNAWLLVIGLLVSSIAAGVVALQRWRVEQANRTVELVLDYSDVAQWAAADGRTVAEWLRRLDTPLSVAITEGTLAEWGVPLSAPMPTYLLDETRFQQAKRMLALKARVVLQRPIAPPYVEVRSEGGGRFWVEGDPQTTLQLGLGLDPYQVAQVRAGGKPIVARVFNPQGVSPIALRGSLMQIREQGARLVIFAGDQVLGYRRSVETTAQTMQANALYFGAVEFAKQMGAAELAQRMPLGTVRVHSITLTESLTLSPNEIIERLERATQERNIRVLYLRAAGADTALLREMLQRLAQRLQRIGYPLREGGARPFAPLAPAGWLFALVGAGVGVLLGWVAAQWRAQGSWAFAPLALGIVFALLCLLPIGRKVCALVAAVAFPTVGMIAIAAQAQRASFASLLVLPFAWSLLGALHVVGLLSETPFLIKADQFVGVKVAHVVPLVVVLAFYGAYVTGRWDFWRVWLARPVLWGQVGLALVMLAALALMLIRTGNEAPTAVPDWELRLRALLESVMDVRPRTKEFLIGHPALVVAVGLLLSRRTTWLPLMMFLATIGQVSIVNTFCHLHSPLMVSLQRTGWGMVLGLALGLALWGVIRRAEARKAAIGASQPVHHAQS